MSSNDNTEEEQSSLIGTRRRFVAGSAAAIGGLSLVGTSFAQEDDEESSDEESDNGESGSDEFEDDVEILNYALTLEYLEASFYEEALDNLSEDDLCNCEMLSDESPLAEVAYEQLETIRDHEQQHVETLRSTIEDLDGEPVEEPSFDFGLAVEYPNAFLETAAQLEDVGVSAYAGAAPSIEEEDLIPPALGIHSVEARHASFLRTLTGETPFPDVVDEARTRSEVTSIAGEFIGEGDASAEDEGDDMDEDEEGTPEDDGLSEDEGTPEDDGTPTEDDGTPTDDDE